MSVDGSPAPRWWSRWTSPRFPRSCPGACPRLRACIGTARSTGRAHDLRWSGPSGPCGSPGRHRWCTAAPATYPSACSSPPGPRGSRWTSTCSHRRSTTTWPGSWRRALRCTSGSSPRPGPPRSRPTGPSPSGCCASSTCWASTPTPPRPWSSRRPAAWRAPTARGPARRCGCSGPPRPTSGDDPVAGSGRRFVVQRHRARSPHYDLRLELDGVLLSWAVPKGPTLDPDARRTAFRVGDHPLEYVDFEGVIPGGQYGAGDVTVWDAGTWTPREGDDPRKALASGSLHVDLHGPKLGGRFVRFRRGGGRGGDGAPGR